MVRRSARCQLGVKASPKIKWGIALHYMHYNFARVHQSLRVTPAMEAGITDHVWNLEEIVALMS